MHVEDAMHEVDNAAVTLNILYVLLFSFTILKLQFHISTEL